MASYRDGQWIGAPAEGYMALGRTNLTAAQRFASANVVASKLLSGHAGVVLAQDRTARPVVPTGDVKATNPTSGAPEETSHKPLIIGAAVLGVLAIGLVAFKVAKG